MKLAACRMRLIAGLLALALAGCDRDQKAAALPAPQEPSAESVAQFCNMAVLDHAGPKGQIFLAGKAEPVWFASVRDAFAFTLLPEEPKTIAAIYVNDMGKSGDGRTPAVGSWIEAHGAWFVAGSDFHADMGEQEIMPFGDEAAATRFIAAHGGRLRRFVEVTEAEVLDHDGDAVAAAAPSHDAHHH